MRPRHRRKIVWLGVVLLSAGLPGLGCGHRNRPGPQLDVEWTLRPSPPVVGPATLIVTVRAPSGGPVSGATVRLEAQMTHAGMAPVVADAAERAPGTYEVPFALTMPGDWVLLVTATLPDGGRVERRFDVANVRPSG